MNKEAARYFHACLNSTVEEARQARAYWRRRGLDDKTIVRFGLGYAPDDGQGLYQYLRDKGYNQQELDASGLFKRSQSGRIYCLFWKRVMTPIFDLRGNIIAFGGRVLDDSKPKYVNSPETLVYHKSDTVFALQIAKKSASRRFVLCEGYMDVISMHQAGIDTAVCACGTAPTPDQVKLISQYAEEVILSYDSDEAGQKATLRSLELFRNSPVKVGVLQIPGAKDPDEYIKKYGSERFKALLDGVGNALDFRLGRLKNKYDLKQDAQRLEYVKEAVNMLAERSNPTEQEVYAGRLAEETNISKNAIMTQLADAVKRSNSKRRWAQNRHGCSPVRCTRSACLTVRAALRRWGLPRQNSGCWPPCSGSPAISRRCGPSSARKSSFCPSRRSCTKHFCSARSRGSKSAFPLCAPL